MSKQVEYAILFLKELASQENGVPLSVRDFCNRTSISFLYMQRVCAKLKNAGLVVSAMGPRGGYRLARDQKNIMMKDVVEAVDGSYGIVDCIHDDTKCVQSVGCEIKSSMQEMQQKIMRVLASTPVVK